VDFEIAINGLSEEPAAEAADVFTNVPSLETVMKCKLGVLRTQPLISPVNKSGVQGGIASLSLLMFAVNKSRGDGSAAARLHQRPELFLACSSVFELILSIEMIVDMWKSSFPKSFLDKRSR